MSVALMSKFQNDPGMKNNPFAGLGMMMLPAIIDKTVDAYVTPEGLRRIIKDGKPQADGNADAGGAQGQPNVDYTSEYVSKDRFRVHLRNRSTGEAGPALLFQRRGFIAWKLTKIELPENWLDKP